MKNIRTLIISDLHLQWQRADSIIKHVAPDKIVFLGDYFDDFGDTYRDNLEMAEWLQSSLSKPDRIHLMGNHDIQYAIGSQVFTCSGFEQSKLFAIDSVLTEENWKQLPFYTWVGSWFCSHAGVHKYYYDTYGYAYGRRLPFNEWIKSECQEAFDQMWKDKTPHRILSAGRSRGGVSRHGGIIWCDVREYAPIEGVNQIFGHTPRQRPEWINGPGNTKSLALDVSHSHYYAIHDSNNDENITIGWIGDM